MTKEQIEQSPMFRIVRKALMTKHPWIKGTELDDDFDPNKYDTLYFMDVIIDAEELAETYGATLAPYYHPIMLKRFGLLNTKGEKNMVYISLFFDDNESVDKIKDVESEINSFVRQTQKNKAIPTEYRLPKDLAVSSYTWRIKPSSLSKEEEDQVVSDYLQRRSIQKKDQTNK